MSDYGYLVHPDLMDKYLAFFGLCEFAGYDDLKAGTIFRSGPSEEVIVEMIRTGQFSIKHSDPNKMNKMIEAIKVFQQELTNRYDEAYDSFAEKMGQSNEDIT